MSDSKKTAISEMQGSLTCWHSFKKANKNVLHLIYSHEADHMFFLTMVYLPSRLYKHPSLHIAVCRYTVEHTELIPFLKRESKLEFNEKPFAILYEHNDKYHLYENPPSFKQNYHLDDLVNWLVSFDEPRKDVSQYRQLLLIGIVLIIIVLIAFISLFFNDYIVLKYRFTN